MRHGSLFSGIGGFDIAAEWMGWENVFHCEYNPFGQRVLKHYWPNAISYGDIKQTDFTVHRGQIDILSGGFPCQPFSSAGKRKGTDDDRHLWPEMLRAIREISPRYIVGENVRGFTNWNEGMVFDQVQADLEAEGYEVTPFLLPACAVNAPHRRDRIWIVAHSTNDTRLNGNRHDRQNGSQEIQGRGFNEFGTTPDTTGDRWKWERQGIEAKEGLQQRPESAGKLEGRFERLCSSTPDTGSEGFQITSCRGKRIIQDQAGPSARGESCRAFTAPPGWQDFPTQPPVRGRNDGLPDRLDGITISKHRKESIMAYGNAIVPQIAHEIFKAIDYAIH